MLCVIADSEQETLTYQTHTHTHTSFLQSAKTSNPVMKNQHAN